VALVTQSLSDKGHNEELNINDEARMYQPCSGKAEYINNILLTFFLNLSKVKNICDNFNK
jgi:hypothetical protein